MSNKKKKRNEEPSLSKREVRKENFPTEGSSPNYVETTEESGIEPVNLPPGTLESIINDMLLLALNSPAMDKAASSLMGTPVAVQKITIEEIQKTRFGFALESIIDRYIHIPDHPVAIFIGASLGLVVLIGTHITPTRTEIIEIPKEKPPSSKEDRREQ